MIWLLRGQRHVLHCFISWYTFWSLAHKPKSTNAQYRADPFGQHAWLHVQLLNARQARDKVYITGHVPPMLQSFVVP